MTASDTGPSASSRTAPFSFVPSYLRTFVPSYRLPYRLLPRVLLRGGALDRGKGGQLAQLALDGAQRAEDELHRAGGEVGGAAPQDAGQEDGAVGVRAEHRRAAAAAGHEGAYQALAQLRDLRPADVDVHAGGRDGA